MVPYTPSLIGHASENRNSGHLALYTPSLLPAQGSWGWQADMVAKGQQAMETKCTDLCKKAAMDKLLFYRPIKVQERAIHVVYKDDFPTDLIYTIKLARQQSKPLDPIEFSFFSCRSSLNKLPDSPGMSTLL